MVSKYMEGRIEGNFLFNNALNTFIYAYMDYGKSSPCGVSGFPFLLSELSSNICLTPYNHK